MGTRADFYVGRGPEAEWLGSVAWDGYPDGFDESLFGLASAEDWRRAVLHMLVAREDSTLPPQGWPWPWDDSGTTDYAYAFDGDRVWGSAFGRPWFAVDPKETNGGEPINEDGEPLTVESPAAVFPNMADRQKVTLGSRSGVMVLGQGGVVPPERIDAEEAVVQEVTRPELLAQRQRLLDQMPINLRIWLENVDHQLGWPPSG